MVAVARRQTSNADTVKIGGLAPLTGNLSIYGIATDNGVKWPLMKSMRPAACWANRSSTSYMMKRRCDRSCQRIQQADPERSDRRFDRRCDKQPIDCGSTAGCWRWHPDDFGDRYGSRHYQGGRKCVPRLLYRSVSGVRRWRIMPIKSWALKRLPFCTMLRRLLWWADGCIRFYGR